MSAPRLVFATESYHRLASSVCQRSGGELQMGEVERRTFPDGERYRRIIDAVANRDVTLIGGTISDGDTLEVYDLACALVSYGASHLTLLLPYFGYSTMERAARPQEVVTAKTRARLLSAIPVAAQGNRAVMLDLHSEGIPHYLEGALSPVHLYAKPLVIAAARRLADDANARAGAGDADAGEPPFVFACTDAGRAKWVESLANDVGVPAAFVFKRRLDGSRTTITAVSAYVAGKPVIIYDDMVRSGGSLINAARAYLDAGALEVSAITTHGLFCGDAVTRLHQSGLLRAMVCTDSHPRALELDDHDGFLQVESIAGLLTTFLVEGETAATKHP